MISAAHDGEQEGGGEEREDHPRPHEAAAQPQVHQLQQCGNPSRPLASSLTRLEHVLCSASRIAAREVVEFAHR